MTTSSATSSGTAGKGDDVNPSLKRQLGLLSAGSFATGCVIGVGIFVSPAPVLAGAGSSLGLSLLVWVAVGGLSFCGALTFADLGSRIKKSGGTYTYIHEAFGELASFMYIWTQFFLIAPGSASLACLTTAEYILRPVFLHCPEATPRSAKVLLALIVLGAMICANLHSAKLGATIQVASTISKVVALIVIIVAGFVQLAKGSVANFEEPFYTESLTAGGLSMAFYSAFYAYYGWDKISVIVEEIKDPVRTVPLATLLGLLVPVLVYALTIVAYHAVISNQTILSGIAVGVVFGERILGPGKWVILVCIAISACGLFNGLMFTFGREFLVGARDGVLPRYLSLVNVQRRTPQAAILTQAALTVVWVCLNDVMSAIGSFSFIRICALMAAVGSVFRLQKKFPAEKNTFQVHCVFPVVFLLFATGLLVITVIYKFKLIVMPLVFCLSSIPVFYIIRARCFAILPLQKLHELFVWVGRSLLLSDFDKTA